MADDHDMWSTSSRPCLPEQGQQVEKAGDRDDRYESANREQGESSPYLQASCDPSSKVHL